MAKQKTNSIHDGTSQSKRRLSPENSGANRILAAIPQELIAIRNRMAIRLPSEPQQSWLEKKRDGNSWLYVRLYVLVADPSATWSGPGIRQRQDLQTVEPASNMATLNQVDRQC